jgi:outer membrane immunogenic protein
MKATKIGIAVMALVACANSAKAQDRGSSTNLPPYESLPSWTGFYLGAAFGGSAEVLNNNSTVNGVTFNNQGVGGQGVLASIYGGYDLQVLPKALVGVMVEGTWASAKSSVNAQTPGTNASINTQPDLGVALLARAGIVATPSTLLYLTGGYAGQNFHTTGTAAAGGAFASFTHDDWFNGWTVGGGLESRLQGPWSAKLEYRYSQFGTRSVGNGITETPSLHAIRAGLTYKFGAPGSAEADEAPVSRSTVNWTGPYLGVEMGAAASVTRLSATAGGATAATTEGGQSVLGGAFGGFDYQVSDRFVIGALGEIAVANPQATLSVTAGGAGALVNVSPTYSWSAMARLGFLASPSTLLYAVGGYTGEGVNVNATALGGGGANFSSYNMLSGWTVGPGVEARIAGGWSTKLEYRYSEYGTQTILPGITVQPSTQTIRLGIAYKFPVPASSQ